MTNLTSPAAEPAKGFPSTMSDIIDSLKRLERIGDENSKTVEKIMTAAKDLEEKIASQYRHSNTVILAGSDVLHAIVKAKKCSLDDAARSIGLDFGRVMEMRYTIEWRNSYSFAMYIGSGEQRVSDTRESALKFSRDIANGLLTIVEQDLLSRQTQNENALGVLAEAAAILKPQLE